MFSIIIPVYNKAKMTEDCLHSIFDNTMLPFEVIIIDNGSSDQVSNFWKSKCTYIKLEKNIFFAGACNLGAKKAKYPVLCFLNNDTLVTKGWEVCATALQSINNCGMVGPKLLYPNDTIQHAGIEARKCYPYEGFNACFEHIYRHHPSDYPPANEMREYQALTGACFFVFKKDYEALSGLDESFINGHEDFDFCMRMRINLGKKIVYLPSSVVYHLETQTPRDETNTVGIKNHLKFYDKWDKYIEVDRPKWLSIDRLK